MKPKLRHVEVVHFQHEGQDMILLRDPTGVSEAQLAVSPAAAAVMALMDGTRDVEAIRAAITLRGGEIETFHIQGLVDALDKAHLLESPQFEQRFAEVLKEYRDAPFRSHRHAGDSYPEQAEELRAWFTSLDTSHELDEPDESNESDSRPRLVGAAAPHIDLRFGGASNAIAHRERVSRDGDADTLVVLGTGHMAGDDLFTLTRQDFSTPLGTVETDVELCDALARRYGEDKAFAAEILHRSEHTVEFQAVFLRLFAEDAVAQRSKTSKARKTPRMLPVLVGSFQRFLAEGIEPYSDPDMRAFVDGLNEAVDELGRRIHVIASIDLSHLGPRYGDEQGLSADQAAEVEAADRALLRFAEQGDAEGFFRHNLACQDQRRVCGYSALYTLLRVLPNARGRLVRYEQTTFPGTEDTVSHCAMLFEEPGQV